MSDEQATKLFYIWFCLAQPLELTVDDWYTDLRDEYPTFGAYLSHGKVEVTKKDSGEIIHKFKSTLDCNSILTDLAFMMGMKVRTQKLPVEQPTFLLGFLDLPNNKTIDVYFLISTDTREIHKGAKYIAEKDAVDRFVLLVPEKRFVTDNTVRLLNEKDGSFAVGIDKLLELSPQPNPFPPTVISRLKKLAGIKAIQLLADVVNEELGGNETEEGNQVDEETQRIGNQEKEQLSECEFKQVSEKVFLIKIGGKLVHTEIRRGYGLNVLEILLKNPDIKWDPCELYEKICTVLYEAPTEAGIAGTSTSSKTIQVALWRLYKAEKEKDEKTKRQLRAKYEKCSQTLKDLREEEEEQMSEKRRRELELDIKKCEDILKEIMIHLKGSNNTFKGVRSKVVNNMRMNVNRGLAQIAIEEMGNEEFAKRTRGRTQKYELDRILLKKHLDEKVTPITYYLHKNIDFPEKDGVYRYFGKHNFDSFG